MGCLAFFGVPNAHEDDPARAIHATLEIHELVKGLSPRYEGRIGIPLSMHSGINTGLVLTAEVDPEKGSQGVTGDAVNLAARLSGLAGPDEILVGEETARRLRGHFVFQDLGSKRVKGKAEPVSVYKLISGKAVVPASDRQVSSVHGGPGPGIGPTCAAGDEGHQRGRVSSERHRRGGHRQVPPDRRIEAQRGDEKSHGPGGPGHLHWPKPELPSSYRPFETMGRDCRGGLGK